MSSCRCTCTVSSGGSNEGGPFTYTLEVELQSGGPQDGTKTTTTSINESGERILETTPIIIDAGPFVSGSGSVLADIRVAVANTANFPSSDANNTVNFIEYCEQLQSDANDLATNLQSILDTKLAAGGGGGGGSGVTEGVGNQCDEPFEIKADGFTINCNSMTVDACGGSKPAVTFNTGAFNITTDGAAATITNGNVTLTISGSTINVTGGQLQVGGNKVATETWVGDNFAASDHNHDTDYAAIDHGHSEYAASDHSHESANTP
jgi:hypothetical protein